MRVINAHFDILTINDLRGFYSSRFNESLLLGEVYFDDIKRCIHVMII